jgi:Fe/S biogenesis protein NfuA
LPKDTINGKIGRSDTEPWSICRGINVRTSPGASGDALPDPDPPTSPHKITMIAFTDRAREMLASFLDEGDGVSQVLRIQVDGPRSAPEFDLTLVDPQERTDDEREVDCGGFSVFVREDDAPVLEGATVDFVERVNESGFEVRPADGVVPDPVSRRPKGKPTGPIAERVREVLDAQVNPTIAAHGGLISLIDVEETEIYVEMSGGCQGCALSRMTLRQGVERMLREAVPELTAVHDITDHASGENPYM